MVSNLGTTLRRKQTPTHPSQTDQWKTSFCKNKEETLLYRVRISHTHDWLLLPEQITSPTCDLCAVPMTYQTMLEIYRVPLPIFSPYHSSWTPQQWWIRYKKTIPFPRTIKLPLQNVIHYHLSVPLAHVISTRQVSERKNEKDMNW